MEVRLTVFFAERESFSSVLSGSKVLPFAEQRCSKSCLVVLCFSKFTSK